MAALPEPIDLSHHLSDLSKARKPSFLKMLQKYFSAPGIINLAGGRPSPRYFPYSSIGATTLSPTSLSEDTSHKQINLPSSLKARESSDDHINIPKYSDENPGFELAKLLQYSPSTGHPAVVTLVKELVKTIYQPKYSFATLIHCGNTDAWDKTLLTLCNAGDAILVGEWTYPTALKAIEPFNIKPVPVALDEQGICPSSLRKILSEWDESTEGTKRPHVLYTVPTGQNPTGSNSQLARKQAIYDACVEFDVIIVEDDPYHFLQFKSYVDRHQRHVEENAHVVEQSEYFSHLTPTYISLDYQGRVIRLDSFSKVIAPGCRLGWFTCAPLFVERLERISEVASLAPCGFSQALVTGLLREWGLPGYLRWLQALALQYQKKRDFLLDCLHDEFHLKPLHHSTVMDPVQQKYVGCLVSTEKGSLHTPVISFTMPASGMFIWITVHLEHHPSYSGLNATVLEMELFELLAASKVVFCPGQVFAADPSRLQRAQEGHFRVSFCDGEEEDVRKAMQTFASTLKIFFSRGTK